MDHQLHDKSQKSPSLRANCVARGPNQRSCGFEPRRQRSLLPANTLPTSSWVPKNSRGEQQIVKAGLLNELKDNDFFALKHSKLVGNNQWLEHPQKPCLYRGFVVRPVVCLDPRWAHPVLEQVRLSSRSSTGGAGPSTMP